MKAIDALFRSILKFLWRLFVRLVRFFFASSDSEAGAEKDPDLPEFNERRRFLNQLSLGLSGLAALLLGIPFIGFLFSSERAEEGAIWRPVGPLEDFPIGETVKVTFVDPTPLPWAGFSARTAAWVRQEREGEFIALSIYCTHVGCPVRWAEGAQLFLCPCHGGSFYRDGSVAGGPPSTALDRYQVRVRAGQVEIRAQPQPLPT